MTSAEQTAPTNPLVGVTWSADLATAARLMTRHDIGALGVYSSDGHELLGVLTERDIAHIVARGEDPASLNARDAMTATPLEAEGPLSRREAKALMQGRHVRHLIVHENGGDRIVSIRDL